MELVFSLAKYVSVILFFFLPYICSKRADSSCFHLHILSVWSWHDFRWEASHYFFFFPPPSLPFNLMPSWRMQRGRCSPRGSLMRAGAAARVRERRPRPKRSRVSKINDLVWRPAPAVQVCLHVCRESDNRGQAPPTQKVITKSGKLPAARQGAGSSPTPWTRG